jgi:hypothetical protein
MGAEVKIRYVLSLSVHFKMKITENHFGVYQSSIIPMATVFYTELLL